MAPIRLASFSGRSADLGYAHGRAFGAEIGILTEERLRLSSDPAWIGGRSASHQEVLEAGRACLPFHEEFAPELMDEVRGMEQATGLGLNELVIMNGFTDFVDVVARIPNAKERPASGDADGGGCTAFIVDAGQTADAQGLLGQTWDMHVTATRHVLMLDLQPRNQPSLMTFTISGCVGMVGMNEYGVAVGINNLLGADGRPGVHWPFVVRKMLAQTGVEAALAVLQNAPLSGAHNYILMGPVADGHLVGYNVEATSTRRHVERVDAIAVHTNHCQVPTMQELERPRRATSLSSTLARLDHGSAYLDARRGRITVNDLMAMTRLHDADGPSVCAHALPDYHVESSGACIMRPQTRELWAVWGNPCNNEYERFQVGAASLA